MKVFISWSGELSRRVADYLSDWLQNVLQIETWVSNKDIEKGAIWFDDIHNILKDVRTGILCITRENMNAPWILFEAGALSKGLTKNRVCPLLIGLEHGELRPPLSQFNGSYPTKEDMLKLVTMINGQKPSPLPNERLLRTFEKWWEEFETKLKEIVASVPESKPSERKPDEMLKEILELTRSIQGTLQSQLAATQRTALRNSLEELRERINSFANSSSGATKNPSRKALYELVKEAVKAAESDSSSNSSSA